MTSFLRRASAIHVHGQQNRVGKIETTVDGSERGMFRESLSHFDFVRKQSPDVAGVAGCTGAVPQLSIRAATVLCAANEQRSHNQTCGSKRKVIRTEHFVAAHVTIDNESRGHTRGWRRISAAFNILARKYAQAFTRAPKKPNLIVPAFPQERCSGSATQ